MPEKTEPDQPAKQTTSASVPAPARLSPYWLWLTGASGFLGSYLLRQATAAGWPVAYIPGQRPLAPGAPAAIALPTTLNDRASLAAAAREYPPLAIIHAAALSTVAGCRSDPAQAWTSNVISTRLLAQLSASINCPLIYCSTDMVFSGRRAPYRESDAPDPVSLYGATKAASEELLRHSEAPAVVARLPLMYGLPVADWHKTQLGWLLSAFAPGGDPITLFRDEYRTPADVRHVAHALLVLASRPEARGTYHLGGPERLSRADFGRLVVDAFGLETGRLREGSLVDAPGSDPRPPDLSMVSDRARRDLGYNHPPVPATLQEWAGALAPQA